MEHIFLPDDPRLCPKWAVNISTRGPAVMAVLLLARKGSDAPLAVHAMTPPEARELAMRLFTAAKEADRAMNEVAQQKEGF